MHAAIRDHAARGAEAIIVSYVFGSIILAVLGLAVVVTVMAVTLPRARARRELARRKGELSSEQELDDLLRQVDQAASAEDLNRLENEGKDNG